MAQTHILGQLTQTLVLEAKLGLAWMSILQIFLLHQFPKLLQSPCVVFDCE